MGWQNIKLFIDGRVALLNAILVNTPVFLFSFYKAPKCIIKEIISIQKSFLCDGFDVDRKISWISWSKICLPEKEGGLGVKHCGIFNLAYFRKWK